MLAQDVVIDAHWSLESHAAVDDTMAHSSNPIAPQIAFDEMPQVRRRTGVIECTRCPCVLADDDTRGIARDELRLFGQFFDLPADLERERRAVDPIQREL